MSIGSRVRIPPYFRYLYNVTADYNVAINLCCLELIYRLTAVRTAERHLVLKGGSHNDIKVMPIERLGVDHPYAYLDNSAAAKHKLDADESAFGLSELAMRGQVARS